MAITGVHETYDGLPDFDNFDDYLRHWIRPNILKDLETVFDGARERWLAERHDPGGPGRGDFVMATALLALFDHFGAFLARPRFDWITPAENIARVARRIKPSLSDIYAIVANMGRNALTHGAWPQTEIDIDVPEASTGAAERWGFGLSFNANSDPQRHDTFHWKPFKPRPPFHSPSNCPSKTIKLVLNVHNLRMLMVQAIDDGTLFHGVTQQQFDRVKEIAVLMGDNRKMAEAAMKDRTKPGHWSEPVRRKVAKTRLCKDDTMLDEVRLLIREAKRLHVQWGNEDKKTPRDYRGARG